MRQLVLWTAAGLGLAMACGLAGLPHLSATLVTLTVFCTVPAFLVLVLDGQSRLGKTRA